MTTERLIIEMDEEESELPPTITVNINNTFYGVPPSEILHQRAGKCALSPGQPHDRRVSQKLNGNHQTSSEIEHVIPATGFSALPPELVAAICEHRTTETQSSLRLVSRKAEAGCTSLLFKRVHLSRSLEDLRGVSGSRLAESVDAVDFYPRLLPDWDKEM